MLTFANRDEFKREKIADNLIKILNTNFRISPLLIHGPWGSGKTEFCLKLIEKIKSENKPWNVIYFDAFKYDHLEDPLLAMIAQITSSMPHESVEKKSLIKKAIPVIKVMGKVAGKSLVAWGLKQDTDDISEDMAKVLNDCGESFVDLGVEKVFEDFEKADENLKVFKEYLAKVTSEQKLVICVDELDRCRPSFVLNIIEKTKHVFDIPNVNFIFTANIDQMESMVKKLYGYSIDASTYLDKFFPFSVQLPERHTNNGYDYNGNAYLLFSNLAKSDEALKVFFSYQANVGFLFETIFKKKNLSLRDAEKFFNYVSIYNVIAKSKINQKTNWMYVILYLLGIFIYSFDKKCFTRSLNGDFELADIERILGISVAEFKQKNADASLLHRIFALLLLELPEKVVNEVIVKEKLQAWQDSAQGLFTNGVFPPKRGERLSIMINAAKEMQLGSVSI